MIKCIVSSWSYRVVELTAESIASLEADLKGVRPRTSKREENQDINLELMLEVLRIVRFPGCDVSRISSVNIAQDKGGRLTRTISILIRCCEKESRIEEFSFQTGSHVLHSIGILFACSCGRRREMTLPNLERCAQ